MRIALFADIHGKLLLPFKLVELYQRETGKTVDLILQCGDMGVFPDIENLDKATLKHASRDRDELGFHDDFMLVKPEVKALLDKLSLHMICVRGNHEDHDFLDAQEQAHAPATRFPIDVYKRVWVCRTGCVQEFSTASEKLLFAGIGRIGDRKGRSEKRFIQDYERAEVKKLIRSKTDLDILITHDKDTTGDPGYGMEEIRTVLDELIIHYHFYGHTGKPCSNELDANGITRTIKIKELEFDEKGALPEGCMLVLEKNGPADFTLEMVSHALLKRVMRFNWRTF